MPKVKSPNYPMLDLGAALMLARLVLDKDNRNKISRAALAKHLGHSSLSGLALSKIGVLRAYGMIDGTGEELRISDNVVTALMAPEGSPERATALMQLAARPKLFQDIRKDFPTPPRPENLKFWLINRKFSSDAAETAANSYLATMRLAAGRASSHVAPDHGLEKPENPHAQPLKPDMMQEVFNLDEGPVTLTVPSTLSEESYADLADQLELFLRRAKRRAAKTNDVAAN